MADKKAKPAASTPAQSYPDPYWPGTSTGPSLFNNSPITLGAKGFDYSPQGAMANTPHPGWGYDQEARQTTPINANPAAMRGYLRNAPYLEDVISSPHRIIHELNRMHSLEEDDVVSQYRRRVLMSALRDIYNISAQGEPGYEFARNQSKTPDDVMTLVFPGKTPSSNGSR